MRILLIFPAVLKDKKEFPHEFLEIEKYRKVEIYFFRKSNIGQMGMYILIQQEKMQIHL